MWPEDAPVLTPVRRCSMRPALILLPVFVLGCAKSEPPKASSAAVAAAPAATLTDADIAGTWTGTTKLAGTDSVISHWTEVCSAGTCRGTTQESKDTVQSTYTIMGDSAVGQSQPVSSPGASGGQIVEHWTIH